MGHATCNAGLKLTTLQDLMKFQKKLIGSKNEGVAATFKANTAEGLTGPGSMRRLAEAPITDFTQLRESIWNQHMDLSYSEARLKAGLSDPISEAAGAKTPKEAWAKLGFNMTDENPDWLKNAFADDADAEQTEAFVRVMKPLMSMVGEMGGTEHLDKKWPLWPSQYDKDEL